MLAGAVLTIVLIMAYNARAQDVGTLSTANQERTAIVADGTFVTNTQFQYQGVLLDPFTGQPKPDGTYNITFNMYNSSLQYIWGETLAVPVATGMFSVLLGQTSPLNPSFFNGQTLWLGVGVNGEPELQPRLQLGRVPYAINADMVGGKTSDSFADYRTGAYSYGVVGSAGDKKSGFHFTVNRWSPSVNAYLIQLESAAGVPINFDPAKFAVIVTPTTCPNSSNVSVVPVVRHTSSDPNLSPYAQIQLIDRFSGQPVQCGFYFAAFNNPG
jgi:hypothetical protein